MTIKFDQVFNRKLIGWNLAFKDMCSCAYASLYLYGLFEVSDTFQSYKMGFRDLWLEDITTKLYLWQYNTQFDINQR